MIHSELLLNRTLSRRRWLQIGGLGSLGLTLPGLLRAAAQNSSDRERSSPVRSCVLFLLHGGPSQLDTWDMKPSAPAEVRGEFQPITTSVPGMQMTELLPMLSRQAHRFSIVRSMTHTAINHNAATYFVTTGQPPPREQIAFTPTENDFHILALKWRSRVRVKEPCRPPCPCPIR
jgi:hypothetical protein